MPKHKVFRVFLSSSFKDMHAERDYLNRNAFAALDARLAARGCRLQVFDLRGSVAKGIEQAQEEAVLRMCIDSVEDCRPRFIGLLGDRYGWVPCEDEKARERVLLAMDSIIHSPHNRLMTEEKEELLRMSVTHMEIYYALRYMPQDACFFYFRNKLDDAPMPEDMKNIYHSADKPYMDRLKEELRGREGLLLREYDAFFDEERKAPSWIEELSDAILRDLAASIFTELDAQEEQPDAYDTVGAYCEAAAHGTLTDEQGFTKLIHARGEGRPIHVFGPHGSGKTTFLAQLFCRLRDTGKDIVLYHSADLGGDAVRYDVMIRSLCHQMASKMNIDLAGNNVRTQLLDLQSQDDSPETLVQMLTLAKEYAAVIVLIDSMDQMAYDDELLQMKWLPPLGEKLDVVVSSVPGGIHFSNAIPIEMEAYSNIGKIAELLSSMAALRGKTFDPRILALAADKVLTGGGLPLYGKLLTEYLMTMTGDDYTRYSTPDAHILWMQEEVTSFPDSEEAAFEKIIARAYAAYGKQFTCNVLDIVAATRGGLVDIDLSGILMIYDGYPPEQSRLYALRGYFLGYLKKGFSADWWDIGHYALREYLHAHSSIKRRTKINAAILQYLDTLSNRDTFKKEEYIWHAFWANQPAKAAAYARDAVCGDDASRLSAALFAAYTANEQAYMDRFSAWLPAMVEAACAEGIEQYNHLVECISLKLLKLVRCRQFDPEIHMNAMEKIFTAQGNDILSRMEYSKVSAHLRNIRIMITNANASGNKTREDDLLEQYSQDIQKADAAFYDGSAQDQADLMLDILELYYMRGRRHSSRRDFSQAEEVVSQGEQMLEKARQMGIIDAHGFAHVGEWFAEVRASLGAGRDIYAEIKGLRTNFDKAQAALRAAADAGQPMDTGNYNYQHKLLASYSLLGISALRYAYYDYAVQILGAACDAYKKLISGEPHHAALLLNATECHIALSSAHFLKYDDQRAVDSLSIAEDYISTLVTFDPSVVVFTKCMSVWNFMSQIMHKNGQAKYADDYRQKYVRVCSLPEIQSNPDAGHFETLVVDYALTLQNYIANHAAIEQIGILAFQLANLMFLNAAFFGYLPRILEECKKTMRAAGAYLCSHGSERFGDICTQYTSLFDDGFSGEKSLVASPQTIKLINEGMQLVLKHETRVALSEMHTSEGEKLFVAK